MSKEKIDLQTCMHYYSNYAYHENINYKIDTVSSFNTWGSVEREILLGSKIPQSDLYAVEAVAHLSFATIDMVVSELQDMKSMPKYKNVHFSNTSRDGVKRTLDRMSDAGLLRCFNFASRNNAKVKILIYCSSDIGIELIIKRLYSKVKYKEVMPSLCPEEEAFRRLVSNACAIVLRERYDYSRIMFNRQVYIPKLGLNRIYGKCERQDGDITRIRIIEPIYFKANPLRVPLERVRDANENRFKVLNRFIETLKTNYTEEYLDLKIIFVYEDYDNIRECVEMVVNNLEMIRNSFTSELEDAMSSNAPYSINKNSAPEIKNVCFTSEPLLYHMGEEKKEFLGISRVEVDSEENINVHVNPDYKI